MKIYHKFFIIIGLSTLNYIVQIQAQKHRE